MNQTNSCGCCACLAGAGQTVGIANRPGLKAIKTRVGTHDTFLDAMIRRLTVPVVPGNPYSLHKLTTREADDPAIALLDAWATVGDVLTFYQERLANEAYLRTATERRSVLELGRLVGYELKPGVSASVFLAYTFDETAKTVIPAGTKAQSIPGANEQPQMFETSEDIEARGAWNALTPRMHQPQEIRLDNVLDLQSVWLDGTTIRIDKRDPILFIFEVTTQKEKTVTFCAVRSALETNRDNDHNRTEVVLEPVRPYYQNVFHVAYAKFVSDTGGVIEPAPASGSVKRAKKKAKAVRTEMVAATIPPPLAETVLRQVLLGMTHDELKAAFVDVNDPDIRQAVSLPDTDQPPVAPSGGPKSIEELLQPLIEARGLAPRSQWQFARSLNTALTARSDYVPRLLTTFYAPLGTTLYTALSNIATGARLHSELRSVHVMRKRAAVFGYNAPTILFEERSENSGLAEPMAVPETANVIHLDTPDDQVTAGSYIVVHPPGEIRALSVHSADSGPRTGYGISGKTTALTLSGEWTENLTPMPTGDGTPVEELKKNLKIIRKTSLLVESEELTLAQQPIDRAVGKPADKGAPPGGESETRIELDGVVDGLAPGRWVIVTGERADTTGTSGVVSAELAMIGNVEVQTDAGAGGTSYSILNLAPKGLAYQYKRESVKVYANVVKATNGETRSEILGGGNAATALQTFTLHFTPLTFVSAPTVDGIKSTLAIRVNDVLWHEVDSLSDAGPAEHVYVTRTADDGKVSVIFGDGANGARLPTGADNVRTVYRSGIGRGGNVRAGQISTAISRPLGVQNVVNPIEASGGADPESRDDARRNIPVSLQAMGRVVSISDYADFARTFAGIAKATATVLSDGRRRLVHLTIGGADDIDIDLTSDLYNNLVEALRDYGDPYQPFVVAVRDKIVVAGSARVQVEADYLWSSVAPKVRAALLDTFSYNNRDFGQPVYPAEVVAAIQNVPGVAYVDLQALGGIKSTNLVRFTDKKVTAMKQLLKWTAEGVAVLPKNLAPAEPKLPKIETVHPILPQFAHHAHHTLMPAQIAYLPPSLADLFILTEITA